jgi:HK97 family phage major capsid protein
VGQQIVVSDDRFGQVTLSAYKVGTLVLVSDELLEDASFNMEEVILNQFASRIGKCEEEAFISGDGNSKPIGLLTQAPVGTVSAEVGKLTMDDAIDLYHSVNARYREKAVWLMSEDAYRTLYKVKSALGRNIWEPSLVAGEPDKLLGRPVFISDLMPNVLAGSKPILFGDFSYYWIGDRGKRSVKRLIERYADKGQVGFLASQRVDAKLVLPEAIQALKVKE